MSEPFRAMSIAQRQDAIKALADFDHAMMRLAIDCSTKGVTDAQSAAGCVSVMSELVKMEDHDLQTIEDTPASEVVTEVVRAHIISRHCSAKMALLGTILTLTTRYKCSEHTTASDTAPPAECAPLPTIEEEAKDLHDIGARLKHAAAQGTRTSRMLASAIADNPELVRTIEAVPKLIQETLDVIHKRDQL